MPLTAPSTTLTLEQIREIARNINHLGAKLYFILLAETGSRPGALLKLKLNNIDLDSRIIKFYEVEGLSSRTKHAWISFFSKATAKFIRDIYLLFRDKWVETWKKSIRALGYSDEFIDEWKCKLLPFKGVHFRNEIYKASEKVLGKKISLYDLRRFHATYLSVTSSSYRYSAR
ncbi:MAG: hypothetical protein DRO23_07685 [Thermoprotei archaeon]|nr:MAG: hypothetical protein B6U76_08620 [Desulfurococcales archaeon ex4484_217_2]RLG74049.1 MAG: hypothetical protein DRO23_07685 [Thermoprotei archaeon]